MIPMIDWLIFATLLLIVGAYGVLTSKNGIVVLMSIEIMLNASNVSLVTFAAYSSELHGFNDTMGQVITLASITVAAAEVAVGLAILLVLYKRYGTIDVTKMNFLRW
ncbi:MAG: NADH-quinone oxidoreductase subunit NuoK [Thermoplasmata archaeon]|nr:NADH-quinone oxidoreductase subunit NuoK [Thermoplasmata archaeon]